MRVGLYCSNVPVVQKGGVRRESSCANVREAPDGAKDNAITNARERLLRTCTARNACDCPKNFALQSAFHEAVP